MQQHFNTSHQQKSFRSDSVWYILTILVFTSLVSAAGYALIQQQKAFLINDKLNEVATIADLKTSQLVKWRKERFAEGASIRANGMMAHRINDYLRGSDKHRVHKEFRLWLANLIDLGEYNKGILFSPDGKVITSDKDPNSPPTDHYLSLAKEAAREHELILSDFHCDRAGDPYDINLAVPIMHPDATNPTCIAVLVLDIDPAKRLYPLIQSWPTTSATAETLLVKREGDRILFLNDLRHRKKTATPLLLPLTNKNMPAVRAALGLEGQVKGVDYRNEAVLGSIRTIPGTKWGMVAKIDVNEVMAPLAHTILMVQFVGVIVVIAMLLGLFLLSQRRRSETLRKLVELQNKNEAELHNIHLKLEQQILERTRDLTDINALLRQENGERKQLERQLLSAKRLEAIGQIAGGVAHEVRNPLNAILTITEALFREKEIENNPEFEPYILHIRAQVNRLVLLMNDLLDLGRTIPAANLQPIPLNKMCCDTLDLWLSTEPANARHAILHPDCNDRSIMVLADPLKLQQVFFNLLENAGHHTVAGDNIVIHLSHIGSCQADDMAVVRITDQGTGIAANKLPHVFEPFYSDRRGGTGLGLALVKHFIENMGGSVLIRNNDPPPGCTVEVRIPLYREE